MAKIKKGDIIEGVEIIDLAADGKAVGKKNSMVIFVNTCVPGDVADVLVTKVRRSYLEGRPHSFIRTSPNRVEAPCKHFGVCGGCKWQHLSYEKQLYFKQKQLTDNMERIAKTSFLKMEHIIPAPDTYYYRNKLEFTFTNKRWLTHEELESPYIKEMRGLGFHVPGLFSKVVDIEKCLLQAEPSNAIRLSVKEFAVNNDYPFFDIKNQQGLLRNIIIRTSNTGGVMVIIIFYEDCPEKRTALFKHLEMKHPEITDLMYVINSKKNDSIHDLEVQPFKGSGFIIEKMDHLQFKIGPKSFFQTNSLQAYTLYHLVKDYAGLTGGETLYDLYTGTGTIALFMANMAAKVIGIEYVPEAIENAKDNARLNHIENTTFICGVMEKILNKELIQLYGKPDVVITDPPRAGMHKAVIDQLLVLKPSKIVYVSCNPATQARDIEMFSEKYQLHKIQAVDMFPNTSHVESIALLKLK